MDYIKQWTYSICITLVIAVIFSLLSSKGNVGKFYKLILSVFIFVSFIYPIASDGFNIDLPEFSYEEETSSLADTYENLIETKISDVLSENSYISCKVDAQIKINDNDEIDVKSVIISIPNEYDKNEIYNLISSDLGIYPEVYYIGE